MSDLINYKHTFLNKTSEQGGVVKALFKRTVTPKWEVTVGLNAAECQILEGRGELSNASLLDTHNGNEGRAGTYAIEQHPAFVAS